MLARRRIPSVHAWTLTDQQLELRRPHRKQQLRLILDSRDTNYIIFCLFQSRSWLVIPLPLVFGSGTGLTAWTLSRKDSTKTVLMFDSFSYPSASCNFFLNVCTRLILLLSYRFTSAYTLHPVLHPDLPVAQTCMCTYQAFCFRMYLFLIASLGSLLYYQCFVWLKRVVTDRIYNY